MISSVSQKQSKIPLTSPFPNYRYFKIRILHFSAKEVEMIYKLMAATAVGLVSLGGANAAACARDGTKIVSNCDCFGGGSDDGLVNTYCIGNIVYPKCTVNDVNAAACACPSSDNSIASPTGYVYPSVCKPGADPATVGTFVMCVGDKGCTGTDVCSTKTANTCVAKGSDDTTCAAISDAKPKWSTVSSACVPRGSDDASCAAIDASKPYWGGDACVHDRHQTGTTSLSCETITCPTGFTNKGPGASGIDVTTCCMAETVAVPPVPSAAWCKNGELNEAGDACKPVTFVPATAASCSHGHINSAKDGCKSPIFTVGMPASCSNGGQINDAGWGCKTPVFDPTNPEVPVTCLYADLKADMSGCKTVVFTAGTASHCSDGGVVSPDGWSCMAPVFTAGTAAWCTNGGVLYPDHSGCETSIYTAATGERPRGH